MLNKMVPKHIHLTILFLLLLLPCFLNVCLAKTRITNITSDQLALLALKSRITELPSHHILAKNWTIGSSVCDWIGVTCGPRHLRVTALNISNMNLTGTIPPNLGNLSFLVSLNLRRNSFHGELPDELSRFRRLKKLDLSFNNFNGQFPPWIGSFQELEYLSIWNNSFTGVIPSSISSMSKLTRLSLSYNYLQGNIPAEIFNISSLQRMDLGDNGFSAGSLPVDMCRHLQKLQFLDLERAGLHGQIPPSIGQCSQLESLYLGFNSLNGKLPKEIGNLKSLQVLQMQNNLLQGAIPKEIGNLSMLQVMDFEANSFTGVIPEEMSKLSNMQYINFEWSKLTGSIPARIFNISSLTVIAFGYNFLSGKLPLTMGYTLPNLELLYLTENSIGGPLPSSITNCSNVQLLDLRTNNFTGAIPNSLGDLSLLRRLYLQQNDLFIGPPHQSLSFITSLVNCKYLEEVMISSNLLDGVLPSSVGNLSHTLETFDASDCEIRGTIPSGIGNLSSLSTLSLSGNHLIGSVPNSVANLQNIQRIHLNGNNMSISLQLFCASKTLGYLNLGENLMNGGTIPDCIGNITSLRYLYLGSSGLTSSMPLSLWNLIDLLQLDLSSNSLTGPLPPEISNLKMSLIGMDFSNNNFSGIIPSTIGDMKNLQNLSLKHNQLQGQIPETIGQMLSLERLDLSNNSLSGLFPVSLEKLQHLSFLNVSFNNLSGKIPSGGPFTNFTSKSFIGNPALCGDQRFDVPLCKYPHTHHGMSKRLHKVVMIMAVAISLAGIMCLGLIHLRNRKKAREIKEDPEGFYFITRKRMSYYQLLQATDGYSQNNLLGVGSFGSVYKGTLENGEIVAIKVFNLQQERSFKSFDTECEILRNLCHRNLIKVVSSCSNLDFMALILEYMPNGSLDNWLHSSVYFLNLMERLNILIDVAYALQYLHCGNSTTIVHCDLKPSNVLLDQEMVAHVSDFGISKLLGMEDSITYTNTLATLCYLAPEYASEGLVSTRCDIYSFGIMMMEVFTRKSPVDEMFSEDLNLRSWVKEAMPDKLANVIDVDLVSTSNHHVQEIIANVSTIMDVALTCTNVYPMERCNIEEVLAILNKTKVKLLPYTKDFRGITDIWTDGTKPQFNFGNFSK